MRILVPGYFVTYFMVCFVWRWVVFHKRTGKNPIILGDSSTPHGYLGLWLKIVAALIAFEASSFALVPGIYEDGFMKNWALPVWARYLGTVFWIASLALSAVAQAQMGRSWRIGINTAEKTEIVQSGLYHYSRNPIYLGMIMTLLGLFLILPNTLSSILLVLGYVLLQIAVRLEETHLMTLHGSTYEHYLKRVPRWF